MTVHRIMGSEVEYGIAVQSDPLANPMVASTQLVNAYAAANGLTRRPRWDFEEETPLRDARGFNMSRSSADSSQLTDEELGLANIILTNGARLYVDHAHPEYSCPEVTNPLDVVRWEKAGEEVMRRGAQLAASMPGMGTLLLYKNNTDNKGASYGSHENYLMRRDIAFDAIVDGLTPFFVSRQVICGAGRVGIGPEGDNSGFQISQRADYFEVNVGLETTLKRPIINTRDEPHADPRIYRRLHVIIGDANHCETAIWLKHGMTAIVLAMIEAGRMPRNLELTDPVAALHAISHDPTLAARVRLADGRQLTGLELQYEYLSAAQEFMGNDADQQTADILAEWSDVLEALGRDPMECADRLDWVAKLQVLQSYRDRDNLSWNDAKMHLIDLQYHDLRRDRGIYHRLERAGRVRTLVDAQDVETAVTEPPHDTRAYFRGKCLELFSSSIAAASWDSVIFDIPGQESLQRVPTMEPYRGTRAHVGELLEGAESATQLFRAITSGS